MFGWLVHALSFEPCAGGRYGALHDNDQKRYGARMMSRALVLILALLSAVAAQAVEINDLCGTWRLLSLKRRVVATELPGRGFLSYSRDGRMNAILVWGKRPKAADMAQATADERDELFNSMSAYAGTFTVDEDTRAVGRRVVFLSGTHIQAPG
jgi:Lipocalin-like domain